MALTIDNLEIQIQAEAQKATSGIDNLAKSMRNLQSAVGNSSGLASNLTQIANAIKTFDGVGKINLTAKINQLNKLQELIPTLGGSGATQLANNLREIASALTAFSAIPKLNVNVGSISKAIGELNTVTASFDAARLAQFSTQMRGIADGLSELSFIGKSNIGSLVNSLKKIPEITASLDPTTIQAFAEAIQRLTSILGPLAWQMDAIARGFNALPKSILRSINATNKQRQANNKLNKSYDGLFKKLSNTASRFWTLYYTASRVADVFADLFNESNEYIESLNLFEVSMGDAADEAMRYAETVSKLIGIDVAEWITKQGTFMRTMVGFGVAADEAELMSKNLTQLGYDLASFFNVSTEEAFDKLESGMTGQIKGLKEYGLNLSVAALQETAWRLGIEQSVRTMTEAQKAQLRYITLLQNSNGIMGDMAKTIMTPANSMRVLSAQIERMKRALGNLVSVIAVKVIPWVMALVEIIEEMATELAEAWGFELPELPENDLEITVDTDALEDANEEAKELKKQLMGFDELNILKSDKEEKEDPSYSLGIDLPEYDFLKGLEGLDLEPYKKKLQEILGVVKDIGVAFAAWKIGKSVFDFLSHGGWKTIEGIVWQLGGIANVFGLIAGSALTIIGGITEYLGVKDALAEGFDWKNLLEIGGGSASLVTGSTIVGKILGKILGKTFPGTFIGMIISGLTMFIPAVIDLFKNGIDWENAILVPLGSTLTGAGIGAMIGSVGGPAGALIGALIGLAIDGIGAVVDVANDDAIPAIELFDETISKATREAVEPFLKKARELSDLTFEWEIKGVKFADFSDLTSRIDLIKERAEAEGRDLTESELSDIATLERQIEERKSEGFVDINEGTKLVDDLVKDAQGGLNANKEKDLGNLSVLEGYLDPETMSTIKGDLLDFYALNEKELNNHKTRFNQILQTAADENRSLTEAEWFEVNQIQNELQNIGVQGLSQTRVEAETIMRNLKDNTTRMSLEQASEIIKDAQKTRDETIKAAEDQYSSIKLWADDMLEVGAINDTEYAEIIKAAEEARDSTIEDAELQYQGIEDATKEKLGETAKYIDFETGNIKTNWDVFCDDVAEKWKTGWNTVSTWWTETAIPKFKEGWRGISDYFAGWYSNFDGSWSGFWTNIGNLFIDIWNGIVEALETAINWIVKALNSLSFKIPDWDVFGDLAGKNFGFNLKTVSFDRVEHIDTPAKVPYNVYSTKGIDNKFSYSNDNLLGISKAIYDGFAAAQAEGKDVGGKTEVVVQIDGETVGKTAVSYINGKLVQTGLNPVYSF